MADYRFRISDAYHVPRRGWMLRLKLLEGDFEPRMLKPGSRLRLVAHDGDARTVTVKGLSTTGGRQKQSRVLAYREFDVVIPPEDAAEDDIQVAIGWHAEPAR